MNFIHQFDKIIEILVVHLNRRIDMKTALVCGAGGFIGSHLVKILKSKGFWVRGVDRRLPEFSKSVADEFLVLDLRDCENCKKALALDNGKPFDEVYQLAADMGGMGFIKNAECEIMHNSILINVNMISEAAKMGVSRYFFSSSVCVYRDMQPGESMIDETGAYPALPDNEYGWEKLYSERMLQAFSRKYGMIARIARFQNCYGPDSAYEGGREKAPAALSRKVAQIEDGGNVEIWGDGLAERNFIYVDDLVRAVYMLMHSELEGAVNIGTYENVTVRQLLQYTAEAAGKTVGFKSIDGPVGVASRNFSIERIRSIGWEPEYSLREGMKKTYAWVREQLIKNGQEVK